MKRYSYDSGDIDVEEQAVSSEWKRFKDMKTRIAKQLYEKINRGGLFGKQQMSDKDFKRLVNVKFEQEFREREGRR